MSINCYTCGKERKELIVKRTFTIRMYSIPTKPIITIKIPQAKLHRCTRCHEDMLDISVVKFIRKEQIRLEKLEIQKWLNEQPIDDFMSKDEVISMLRDIFKEEDIPKVIRKRSLHLFSLMKGKERFYYGPIFKSSYERSLKFYARPIKKYISL